MTAVYLVDGQIVSDNVRIREHQAEYFEQQYQVDPPAFSLDASDVAVLVPDLLIRKDPPTLTEAKEAISKMMSRKGAELLKVWGKPMAQDLYNVLTAIWPVVGRGHMWKGKEDRCNFSNYIGIALFCIPGKDFAHILLEWVHNHLLRNQRLQQSGFTPGTSISQRFESFWNAVMSSWATQEGV